MIKGFIASNQNLPENNTNTVKVEETTSNENGNIVEAGNLHNKGWYNSSNIVYSEKGIAPTLTAMQGGNIKPKVMVERIGGIFDKEGEKHQAGSVYNKEGIAPPLDTMQGGYRQPMVNVINATKKGYDTATVGDSINMTYPYSNKKRGRVGHGVAHAENLIAWAQELYSMEGDDARLLTVGSNAVKGGKDSINHFFSSCLSNVLFYRDFFN